MVEEWIGCYWARMGKAHWILRNTRTKINLRDVRRHSLTGLTKADAMDAAAANLVVADWLLPAASRDSDIPGRQTKDFDVNALILIAVYWLSAGIERAS